MSEASEVKHEYAVQVYCLVEKGGPQIGTFGVVAPLRSCGTVAEVVEAQFGRDVFFEYQRGKLAA